MAPAAGVEKITDAAAMLAKAVEMEQSSARDYNASAQVCGTKKGTRTGWRSSWTTGGE